MPDANDPNYIRAQRRYQRELDRIAQQTEREAKKHGRGYAWQNEEELKAGRKIPRRKSGVLRKATNVFRNPRNR